MLQRNAEDFLKNTDMAYSECETGIANLDRIVVSVNSAQSSMARGYLLPIIYAYWERFFKIVFSEFLVCFEKNNILLKNANEIIAKFRLKKELLDCLKNRNTSRLHDLPKKHDIKDLSNIFRELALFFDEPIKFQDPSTWIETESNVRFEVLEANCKNLGINLDEIKNLLIESKIILYPALKDLVDARNRIAHGQTFEEIKSQEWESIKSFVLSLMTALQLNLYEFLNDKTKVLKSVA